MADEHIYPAPTPELTQRRKNSAPKQIETFRAWSQSVFAPGALDAKTKQLIAIAVANTTQCAYCIKAHTKAALKEGATQEQIMEAIWVAAEIRAGGAYSHALVAMDTISQVEREKQAKA